MRWQRKLPVIDWISSSAVNSSSPKKTAQKRRHALRKGDVELVEFLNYQIPWIQSWKFDARRQPQKIVGWQIAIRATLALWEDISTNCSFVYLLTRRLQQDRLENIFGIVRQKNGCNTKLNVGQFISGTKHICIQKPFKLSENNGNVENDRSKLFQGWSPFSRNNASLAGSVECGEPMTFNIWMIFLNLLKTYTPTPYRTELPITLQTTW